MQQRFEKTMFYLIVTVVIYYGLPILCAVLRMPVFNVLPLVNICAALAINFFFGKKYGGDWLMSLESAAAFVPAIYMFYNETAWIFVPIIAIASLFSLFIGVVFKNRFIR